MFRLRSRSPPNRRLLLNGFRARISERHLAVAAHSPTLDSYLKMARMDTSTGSRPAPPGPLDDAGYRYLPGRLRSYLAVLPRVVRNPPDYFVHAARRYGGVVTLS